MTHIVRPADLPAETGAVLDLAASAKAHDGESALNEESTFAVTRPSSSSRVLVAVETGLDAEPPAGQEDAARGNTSTGPIVAVLVDAQGDASGMDLFTAPERRRSGAASALLDLRTSDAAPDAHYGVWAHGDLPEARGFAAARGLRKARDLWRMSRDVTHGESFDTALPDGFSATTFDGSDVQAQEWLDVNAAAFVHHPEQGRMTMADFRERAAEAWFDPEGLMLVRHDASGALAGSHWTKREPGSDEGEVYVVAVAPQFQGQGLAGPLTALGLEHLARSGVTRIDLYVEGDNEPAKATYARRGFARSAQDVMYVHPPA